MTILDDVRLCLRVLIRRPALSAIAIIAIALGVGLTTTMFSIVYGAIIRGLPFDESEDLIHLELSRLSEGINSMGVSAHDLFDWRASQQSFEGLAAFTRGTFNVSGAGARPERYEGASVTANTFDLLRIPPALGRGLQPDDDQPGSPPVVVLSDVIWRDRFDSDPAAIGQTLRINGEVMTIIGVMPERFAFPVTEYLWVPLRPDPLATSRGESYTLEVFGRLKSGVSLEAAGTEFAELARRLEIAYPESNEGVGTVLKPYIEEFIGDETITMLFTMLGAVFGVLLVACANVANLLLSRAILRTKEVAVRCALGASRVRVISLLLTEALVLAVLGGSLGLVIANVGIDLFNAAIVASDPPFWIDIKIDFTIVSFVLGLVLLTTILSGGLPALQSSNTGPEALNDEFRGSTSVKMGRLSRALVVTEIALSCGLLVAAGLMIQSLVNVRTLDLGFSTSDVFTARVLLFENDYPTGDSRLQFFENLEARLESIPGVRAASLVSQLPGRPEGRRYLAIQGEAYATDGDFPLTRTAVVTPDSFAAVGVRILQGRDFSVSDLADGPPVAIVNRSFVEKFFPDRPVLGEQIRFERMDAEQPWMTVVGVVPDLSMAGIGNTLPQDGVYVPLMQHPRREITMALRADGPPLGLTSRVRDEVAAVDPTLPIYFVRTLEQAIDSDTWFVGVFGSLFMAFGAAALFLASIGLYGVVSFSVSQRTREIGVRMALGADTRSVLWLILREGILQLAVGVVIGLGLAAGLSRMIQVLLFGVEPWDPTVFTVIAVTLAAAGTLASFVPAKRATRIDPMQALRYE